jgi:hypothetical protein
MDPSKSVFRVLFPILGVKIKHLPSQETHK